MIKKSCDFPLNSAEAYRWARKLKEFLIEARCINIKLVRSENKLWHYEYE